MSHVDTIRQDRSPPDLRLPPGHVWTWVKELGAGGEGTAHLWAQLDESQNIVERVVIRNTDVRPSQRFMDGPNKGEWIELYIQQQLVPDGSNKAYTVPVLAASRISGTTGFRSYMYYYSKGDLHTVISDHTRYRPLPEPFLWYTFHRLANALVAMDERFREPGRDKPVVVHNDIKPGNILMGYPGSLGRDVNYISYPPAYLGDFGLSYLTSDDIWTWRYWIGRGTRGYFAPESDIGTMPLSARRPPTSKANVYQVGKTLLTAMMRPGNVGDHYVTNPKWLELINNNQWSDYSQDLIDLVEDCLHWESEERPSPQELLAMIEDCMPLHEGEMKRWGTLSWVKNMSRWVDGQLESDDEAHADADTGTDTATGKKRKASGPSGSAPDPKRIKAQTALDRRLTYVASLIKGVKPRPVCHADDQDFALDQMQLMSYRRLDSMFDPETFFDTADPGPIDYLDLDLTEQYTAVIDIDDSDDDNDDDQDGEGDGWVSLPAPFTPAGPRFPPKGAGTKADPLRIGSTPAKPTDAKIALTKPAPAELKPAGLAPAGSTKPPPTGSPLKKELFSGSHWS